MKATWIMAGCITLGALLAASAPARAFDGAIDMLQGQPPKRLALVVGNADYKTVAALPGAVTDAERMAAVLKGIGFETEVATNVRTRAEFLYVHFLPFVARIREGDVVLFYFSGHGFTFNGDNYLTTLDVPVDVSSRDVFSTFLETGALHELMAETKPSLLLMLLDACRSLKGFKITRDDGSNGLVAKGFAGMKRPAGNVVIGFSSDIGAESWGSATTEPSVYTVALTKSIPISGRELHEVRREVRTEVLLSTGERQVPWFSDSSSAEFYFRPTATIEDELRKFWQDTLQEGTKKSVRRYLWTYGTGPWGARARDWLRLNPDAPEDRPSQVSPAGPEAVWQLGMMARNLVRFDGNLLPPSTISNEGPLGADKIRTARAAQIARAATPEAWNLSRDAVFGAQVLANAGEALVGKTIEARAGPSMYANAIAEFRPGQSLVVHGSETDADDNVWMKGSKPGDDNFFYVPLGAAGDRPQSIGIGKPLLELFVKPRASGLQALVDEEQVKAAVRRLAARGQTISWASLAIPATTDERDENLQALRALHVRSILVRAGVARDRITTVEKAPLDQPLIRLRLFGR